jgi:hypothetical protein
MSDPDNRLVLIGNGFDLAHGLKTSYRNFIDWYMCKAFHEFCKKKTYEDCLIEIKNKYNSTSSIFKTEPTTFEEVLNFIGSNDVQSIKYSSNFFQRIITSFKANNWVDIEIYYFKLLKAYFLNPNLNEKKEIVLKLNAEFDYLIQKLSEYIEEINTSLRKTTQLKIDKSKCNLSTAFATSLPNSEIKFLNFNYTDTLTAKDYAYEDEVIHIHGRVSDIKRNPIIFGYGDESDPAYQKIEDSGENIYLEHIKSFGYFKTDSYHKLLSYIDSAPYIIYIVGHSCGLSDRILLNEIFENNNCQRIEIFYHNRKDGSNNFKEITQEISRHFKPNNKGLMRRKVMNQDIKNFIPQN